MIEIWKDLIYQGKSYAGVLQVSNTGKLKRVSNNTIYKLNITGDGYLGTVISISNHKKMFRVHKAVAETFIPNLDNKPQVNHIDGNKLNNNVSNLEWATNKENSVHAIVTGLHTFEKVEGELNVNAKLTDDDVRYIRDNYIPRHKNFGARALARKFNISHVVVSKVINRNRWKHIN